LGQRLGQRGDNCLMSQNIWVGVVFLLLGAVVFRWRLQTVRTIRRVRRNGISVLGIVVRVDETDSCSSSVQCSRWPA